VNENDSKRNEPSAKSPQKLTLKKETIRVINVQSGVRTGLLMTCPATCGLATIIISGVSKPPKPPAEGG
jgi:hypothetical protein